MDFNVSTFIFEIINFLILIWILQRLFYKPILAVIDKRKQFIDQSLADAKKLRQEAEELRGLYENRQKLWMQEKKTALNALNQQIEAEKNAQMDKLQVELEQERQKAMVALARQLQEHQQLAEKQAMLNGARFAGLLLKEAAGPELETRLFRLMIDNFAVLPEACRLCLQLLEQDHSVVIKVTSAYPLADKMRHQLEQRLGSLISGTVNFEYFQDDSLIAGARIDIGAWVLHANLKHELTGFAEVAYESE